MPADHHPLVIKTTITIADIEPPIWRRILLPRELNFAQLHEVIQAPFGWTDSHRHHFVVGGLVVGAPEFDEDELATPRCAAKKVRICTGGNNIPISHST